VSSKLEISRQDAKDAKERGLLGCAGREKRLE
jgi:hypothetical protein